MEELIKAINNLNHRDFWDFVVIFSSLMLTLFVFLTYFLARKINNKIDKPVIEKQLSKVYELIEVLQDTSISITKIKINGNVTTQLKEGLKIKFFDFVKNPITESTKTALIIEKTYYERFEFLKYSNDPFIPKKIAQLLEKFDFNFDTIFENNNEEYYLIGTYKTFVMNELNKSRDIYFIPSQINNYEDFVDYIKKINSEIINWIKNQQVDLNLK